MNSDTKQPMPFDSLDAMIRWESGELSEAEEIRLFQYLVDTGLAWTLQGCYGRQAAMMLEQGLITKHAHAAQ